MPHPWTSSSSIVTHEESLGGNDPRKEFPLRSKTLRRFSAPSSSGMDPRNLFPPRSKISRYGRYTTSFQLVKFPSSSLLGRLREMTRPTLSPTWPHVTPNQLHEFGLLVLLHSLKTLFGSAVTCPLKYSNA